MVRPETFPLNMVRLEIFCHFLWSVLNPSIIFGLVQNYFNYLWSVRNISNISGLSGTFQPCLVRPELFIISGSSGTLRSSLSCPKYFHLPLVRKELFDYPWPRLEYFNHLWSVRNTLFISILAQNTPFQVLP